MRVSARLLALLALATLSSLGTVSSATAQTLSGQSPLGSWWASPDEPPMTATEGTLEEPEGVRLEFADGRVIRGWEAIVFLLARHYIEPTQMDGVPILRTTQKYKDWKKTRLEVSGTGSGVAGSTTSGSGSTSTGSAAGTVLHTFAGGIDPDFQAASVAKAEAGGAELTLRTTPFTIEFISPDRIRVKPEVIRHVWEFTYSTGMVDRVEAICRQSGGGYTVLDPSDPIKMVGGWGFGLECQVISSRDGTVTSDVTSAVPVMIHYDQQSGNWILNPVGVMSGQWAAR